MDILLTAFINRLESLPDNPSTDELKRCVLEAEGGKVPIDKYIIFSDQEYKRNVVHVSSKCEIAVLCFKKWQATPIHDHGGSIGITIIRDGLLSEELFTNRSVGMIVPTFSRRYYAGDTAYVNFKTIHRVSNTQAERLIAINIYFPPLTLMNVYNLENSNVEKWTNFSSR